MCNIVVKLENVKKRFDKKIIVKDLNLEIKEGEFITFLGPSGCGKTTILRMISGLESVDEGTIFIDNENANLLDSSKRHVNTIFQNFALFTHMTVEQNIAFGLKMKNIPKEEISKKVKSVLKLVYLDGYEKRKPRELSGGEQQRVAIARAIVCNPKVLLLDEPLSSLDLKLKKEMQIELKRLQKKLGLTFIYVTHNQDEALTMSDRIAIISGGEIKQIGTPSEIYEKPNSTYVADFIGESNILKGVITKISGNKAYLKIYDDILVVDNNDYKIHQNISIVLRPEDITISKTKSNNMLKAVIDDNIYDGSIIKTIAKYNNKEIKINSSNRTKIYSKNEEVYLNFKIDNLVLIEDI